MVIVKAHAGAYYIGRREPSRTDTGLYKAHTILYIRTEDYGPKPKVGKPLVMDAGTDHKRTFDIMKCEEEAGSSA
ncbi:MAG: hypothetical protein ACLU9S_00015 [Oscillospiraceae bacterium]